MCSILEHKKTQREWEWGGGGQELKKQSSMGHGDRGRNSLHDNLRWPSAGGLPGAI